MKKYQKNMGSTDTLYHFRSLEVDHRQIWRQKK